MKKDIIIVANWKMTKTVAETKNYINTFYPLVSKRLESQAIRVFIAPSFTALHAASEAAKNTPLVIGAQNMCFASEGAYTGEISSRMIKEAGAKFVLIGHSERRHIFHESSMHINEKALKALEEGLTPLLCIGETLKEREEGHTESILTSQLAFGLKGVKKEDLKKVIIAYEPVWAIGTGVAATSDKAQEAHFMCRHFLQKTYGEEAQEIPLLYGGSVKADVMKELMKEKNIDGVLVGGASLNPHTFSEIVNCA